MIFTCFLERSSQFSSTEIYFEISQRSGVDTILMGTFSLSTYNFLFLKAFAHFHLKQTARHAAEVVENQQD